MNDFFKMGGWGMYPTMAFGLILFGIAVGYARNPDRRWGPLLVASSLMTLLSGSLGFVTGLMATTLAGVPSADPANRFLFSMVGFGESLANVALALAACAVATLASAVGAFRSMRLAPVGLTARP